MSLAQLFFLFFSVYPEHELIYLPKDVISYFLERDCVTFAKLHDHHFFKMNKVVSKDEYAAFMDYAQEKRRLMLNEDFQGLLSLYRWFEIKYKEKDSCDDRLEYIDWF